MQKQTGAGVILPAGGISRRLKAHVPKQFLEIGGKPLYHYSLEAFSACEEVREIVLVVPEQDLARLEPLLEGFPRTKLAAGGEYRWQSVKNGFQKLSPDINVVMVHDAARPFVSRAVINRCIELILQNKTCVPGIPLADTLKEVQADDVVRTVDRAKHIQAQTPQGFTREVLEKIYTGMESGETPPELVTDEAGMAEFAGLPVSWFEGSRWNRKITRREDLPWAEWVASLVAEGRDLSE